MNDTKVVIRTDTMAQIRDLETSGKPLDLVIDELLREALEVRRDREAFIAEFEREQCPF